MRGSLTKRSEYSWPYRINLSRDEYGRRKQASRNVRGTKKGAETVMVEGVQVNAAKKFGEAIKRGRNNQSR